MNSEFIKNARILIVDDNATNLRVLYDYLSKFELEVHVAQDGNSALAIIAANKPDMILLDIMMPGITGIELCKKLKSESETSEIPVIFISALSELKSKIIGFDVGGVDYITKPFQREEVLARVNAHLTIRQQRIDLKRQIEERTRTEQKYKSLLENTPVGIVIIQDYKIKYANSACEKLVNSPVYEITGKSVLEYLRLIPSSDLEQAFGYLKKIISNSLVQHRLEIRLRLPDAGLRWFELIFTLLEYEDKQALQVLISDITNRVEMLELINKTSAQLNALVETIPDIIYFKDAQGRYLIINRAYELYTGLKREQVLGRSDIELFEAKRYLPWIESDKIVFEEAKPFFAEETEIDLFNIMKIYETNKYPIINSQGVSVGLVGISRDITERKSNENQIRAYADELKTTNASKDKFFSIIAHDLKSPFTGFLGFSEYMARYSSEISTEDLEDFSKRMYESAKIVFNLLENLLQWSRLQTNRIEYEAEELNLLEIVTRIISLNAANATKKQIHLLNSINTETFVLADDNMLETVLRNLISNAIKFTFPGGIVHLTLHKIDGFAEITVSDTGTGMSEDDIAKLFKIDQHFRAEGTDREQGTGLGLILCKEFVEKNGGKIKVESAVGKGSKFAFTVPLVK